MPACRFTPIDERTGDPFSIGTASGEVESVMSAIRDPPSNRSGTRSSDKRPGTQRVRGTAEMPWVELILSRTTGCREGPSNVRLLRTFQDVALLDAGLLRCPVAGPSTSGRE